MEIKFNRRIVLLLLLVSYSAVSAQTTQEDWQKKAVADYPELGVQGSELNMRYVQKVKSLRYSNPSLFQNPRWPYTIAEELGKKSIIPGLEDVTPVGQASPKTAYADNKRHDIISAKDLVAKGTQGQKICLEGTVVETSQRTMSAKDKFTVKLSPDILCEFLVPTFLERNRSAIPDFGHARYSSEAKIVVENSALSIYAPPAYRKPVAKVGQIFKPGEKVIIYGQYSGTGSLGLDKGYLIQECVIARPNMYSSP